MKITSHGAARTVTGSKHLLEVNGRRILFDCGLFQGARKESEHRNRELGLSAESLDAVVLSHAHIDHSGVLPVLVRRGFRGRIYTTCATRDLCAVMLLDSAHIQKRDAQWLSQKHRSFVAPLYDEVDVRETLRRMTCLPYGEWFNPTAEIRCVFEDAGHVLGSAITVAEFQEHGRTRRFIYGGDLGRKHMPILRDPWVPNEADVVIMESTYGNRDHAPMEEMDEKLAGIVREACARDGKIIIPSFALERAQEIVYALKRLEIKNAIPPIPVYVDSPLTVSITEIFRLHPECFDEEMRKLITENGDPFQLRDIHYISRLEDSMALNSLSGPAIIISASGMCEQGRILHHLRNHIEDERNFVVIVGFQAKNTLGRRIVKRAKEIRIFGVMRPLNAEVRILNGFSAHAGRSELLDFGAHFKDCAEKILLVHGEDEALDALQTGLKERGVNQTIIQEEGVAVEV